MRKSFGLSSIEFVAIVIAISAIAYVVLPRFINTDPEAIKAKLEATKKKAELLTEALSSKKTSDLIEQEMGTSKKHQD